MYWHTWCVSSSIFLMINRFRSLLFINSPFSASELFKKKKKKKKKLAKWWKMMKLALNTIKPFWFFTIFFTINSSPLVSECKSLNTKLRALKLRMILVIHGQLKSLFYHKIYWPENSTKFDPEQTLILTEKCFYVKYKQLVSISPCLVHINEILTLTHVFSCFFMIPAKVFKASFCRVSLDYCFCYWSILNNGFPSISTSSVIQPLHTHCIFVDISRFRISSIMAYNIIPIESTPIKI